MADAKKPKLPTSADVRAQIDAAEHDVLAATVAFGEALVVQAAVPDREVATEQAAVDQARQRVEQLKLMLPIIERAEAAALEETRARLADEQRKRLAKELENLLKQAMSLAAHQANAVSAWHRLVSAGEACERFLFDQHRRNAISAQLSAGGLRRLADQEINRIGLRPSLEGGVSAPGANHSAVPLNFANAPRRLPSLESEIRELIAAVMRTAPAPLARAVASEDAAGLPQQAAAGSGVAPTSSAEAPACDMAEEAA